MGKAKRGRKKPKVPNPVLPGAEGRKRNVAGSSADREHVLVCEKESEIQTVIEQLQSAGIEDKILGLHSLATVFDEATSVADVMRHKVVRLAAPLLLERSSFVRNAAAGALRNLSACGSEEVCAMLVEQDVMTPLQALISKYVSAWAPTPRRLVKEDIVDEQVDTFVQCVHLLWNLCETSGQALKLFNDGQLLPVLVKCLDYNTYGIDTSVAVAHCLNTVSEDNMAASVQLKQVEVDIVRLVSLEGPEPGRLLLRVLACGLLVNIGASAAHVTLMVHAVSDALDVDARQHLHALSSDLRADEDATALVASAAHLLLAQQTALEILANLCDDDGDEDAMEQEVSDGSDELPADWASSEGEQFVPTLATDVHEAVVSCRLLEKAWKATVLPAENVCDILRGHKQACKLMHRLSSLRCRAFLCLNNLLSRLDTEDCDGTAGLYRLWLDIGRTVFQQEADTRLLEAATAAMRAALGQLAQAKAGALFAQLQESDVQPMFTGAQQCADANVRANLIRSVGTLGMIVTHLDQPHSHALLKSIGRFLCDVSIRETELWVSAEALDAIMDVFGEDETDSAAADISLVDRLLPLATALKHKVRVQRKSLGEHRHVVMTVNANLSRFIDYKSGRLAAANS